MNISKKFYVTSSEVIAEATKDSSVLIRVSSDENAESCIYRIHTTLGSNFFIRHIIFRCPGTPGFLRLGRNGFDSTSLGHFRILRNRFVVTPSEIGASRTPQARIILFCGNVGEGARGRNFLRDSANVTDVPVMGGCGLNGQQKITAYPGESTLINHGATSTYTP